MDAIAPVATQVNPPNPQQAFGTLSSIIGLRQQQQNLQTGQYNQQAAQAGAQQAQQKNQELQALSQFTQNASKDPSYLNPDGSLNTQKFQQDASKVAPVYGQAYIGQMTNNAIESLQSRQALLNLTNDQRQTAGSILGAYAQDPTADHTKFLDTIEQARQVSNDPGYQRAIDGMVLHAPSVSGMPDTQASATLRNYARNAAVAANAPNAGTSAPTTSDYTTPGGAIGQRQTNPMSPMGMGPVGPQVAQGLGPTQTPGYQAAITAAASRASGTAGIDVQRANQVSAAVQPSGAGIQLSQGVDDLADQIHSGKFVASISQAAAAVGMSSSTYARQLLAKDLGQLKTLAIKNAPSDQASSTIESGYPEVTSDPQTIHTAMDYIRGSFKQNIARGQLLSTYRQSHPDLTGFQNADDAYTSSVNPLMAEFKSLKTPQQRIGFYQRNFKSQAEAEAFKNQVQGVSGGP